MKISEMMCKVTSCGPRMNVAQATDIMWRHDCGVVPVVDEQNHLVGIVTDRDICVALGTRNVRASELCVQDVMTKTVYTCSQDDDMKQALATMHTNAVRRLPVVGADKKLMGMLSLRSMVRHATPSGDLSQAMVMNVIKRLSERRTDDASGKTCTSSTGEAMSKSPVSNQHAMAR